MKEFQADTINPIYVKGAISVMNDLNFLNIADVVSNFLNDSSSKEVEKQEVYQKFVEAFTSICRENTSNVLNLCADVLVNSYMAAFLRLKKSSAEEYEDIKKLMRKVLNDPVFIDGMKSPSPFFRNRCNMQNITKLLHNYFEDKTITSILTSRTLPKTHFLLFGSHPALLKNLSLQKKWIYHYAKSKLTAPYLSHFYITDEALKSVPINIGLGFAFNYLNYARIEEDNPPSFKLDTLARIATIYSVANGKDWKVERVFLLIEDVCKNKNFKGG